MSQRHLCIGLLSLFLVGAVWLGGTVGVAAAQELDQYGGYADLPAPGGATGFFRIEKIGKRWSFVTPLGNVFWMRGVYVVDWGDGGKVGFETYKTKYKSEQTAFAAHALKRLRSWGFNSTGPYSSIYTLPVPANFAKEGNKEKMPFLRLLNVSWYGAINQPGEATASWGLAPAPFKTLIAGGVDPAVYNGWPGHTPDVFDPNFETFARNMAADIKTKSRQTIFTEKTGTGGLPHPSLVDSPWMIGTVPDDVDYVFGIGGPGPEVPGVNGVMHPHLGWIVAVTRPTQTQNEVGKVFGNKRSVTYSDPTVYAKVAWRDFLKNKYGTIEKLNAAWGATYTTFDSDGGWPMGKGLMDENGRNPWIGKDYEKLSKTAPPVRDDLDAFLEIFADHYFQVVTDVARAATPKHLAFCPAMLNGHKGLSRRQILRAAGRHCDAIEVNQHPDKLELMDITYSETNKPLFTWVGSYANPDSAMSAHPNPGGRGMATQAKRGEDYHNVINRLLTATASNGDIPMMGIVWWEYMDKWGEKANWGLISPLHNAYDGKEAVRAAGTDVWGYPTGGEEKDYGDFLGKVREAHDGILKRLREERTRPGKAGGTP